MKWENLREEEFSGAIEKSGGLCVIPLGCLEKHGQHLAVGIDYMNAVNILEEAAKLEDVVIFPIGPWMGDVTHSHSIDDPGAKRKRGFIGINPHTLLTVLEELCDEIARNGFRKILIVSGHGGNIPLLNYFVRAQIYKKRNYATMWTAASSINKAADLYAVIKENRGKDFPYITDEDMEVLARFAETGFGGGHADFRETAALLAIDPTLVAPDRYDAESGLSTHRADYLAGAGVSHGAAWGANFPNAYNGYAPHGCSATIGKAITQLDAQRIAGIFKMLKEDEDCVRMAMGLPKEEK